MERLPSDVLRLIFSEVCNSDLRPLCGCIQARFIRCVSRSFHDVLYFNQRQCIIGCECVAKYVISNIFTTKKIEENHKPELIGLLISWRFPTDDMLESAVEVNSVWGARLAVMHDNKGVPKMVNTVINNKSDAILPALGQMLLVYNAEYRNDFIMRAYYAGAVTILAQIVNIFTGHPYGIGHLGSPIQQFPVPKKNKIIVSMEHAGAPAHYENGREYMLHLRKEVVQQYIMELLTRGWPTIAIGLIEFTQVYNPQICTWCRNGSKLWPREVRKVFHRRIMQLGICKCGIKKRKTV